MPNALAFLECDPRTPSAAVAERLIKWRIETYSGMKAETMTGWDVARFTWKEKGTLLRFLMWTGSLTSSRPVKE